MKKLDKSQRKEYGKGLISMANITFGTLIIGQFLDKVNWWAFGSGFILLLILYILGLKYLKNLN